MGQIFQDILGMAAMIPGPQQPFVGLAAGLDNMGNSLANQGSNQAAYGSAYGNQGNAYAQAQELSKQLAQGPDLQALIGAEKSGINTFKSNIGGVPNPGALVKELYGGSIENALNAALNNRSTNLQGAINGVLGAGGGYNAMTNQAASAAKALGNPFLGGANQFFSSMNQLGRPGGSSMGGQYGGQNSGYVPGYIDTTGGSYNSPGSYGDSNVGGSGTGDAPPGYIYDPNNG